MRSFSLTPKIDIKIVSPHDMINPMINSKIKMNMFGAKTHQLISQCVDR